MKNVQYYRLTTETVEYVITDEKREELKEALREKLRQMAKIYRIGYYDPDEDTFEEYDIETVELSVDHDVTGDAMDKVWVQYSLQFDTIPRETRPYCDDCREFGHEAGTNECPWEVGG